MSERAHQGEVAGTHWVPGQYLKFAKHRLWPALELLDRIPLGAPGVIYDLGCGSGHLTRLLAERWSSSEVYGLDHSPQMLAEAAGEPSTVHWVNGHFDLFPRLMGYLNPGGCLAVQMPLSWDLPSHRLMRETLAQGGPGGTPIGDGALQVSLSNNWVEDTDIYHNILAPCTRYLDIWETQYLHVLEGEDPVFEWVRGSVLRPILNSLRDADRNWFLNVYKQRLRDAYPKRSDNRTLYQFRRLFIVALA